MEKWETLRDNLLAWEKFLLTLLHPDEATQDERIEASPDKPVVTKIQTEVHSYVG